jgi:hypothetical protein
MKKLLALLVFCLAFTPLVVRAVVWFPVEINEQESVYLDLDSIKKADGNVYGWYLVNFQPHFPDHPQILSAMTFISIECDLFSYRKLQYSLFPEHSGKGKVLHTYNEDQQVRYAMPDSRIYIVVKSACDFSKG